MSQQISPPFHVYSDDTPDAPAPHSYNSTVMVGAIIVLFLVIFLILIVHLYAKWFLQRSSRSYTMRRGIRFVSPQNAAASALIDTGLDKATITQLPTFIYKATYSVDNLEAGKLDEPVAQPSLECAVCLSEFQENENVRMLPSCKHTFHTECIDMWFFSHSTCPLCRTKVGLAMATSPKTPSTDEQHHEGEDPEAMEPSSGTTEVSSVASNAAGYPCNVLFWGNQTQMISSQEPSSSSLPFSGSLHMPGSRALPQITIDIPPIEGNLLVSASAPLSAAKCTTEQEACSSQPLKSPGFRASIKRMLSRQSSRQKSSSQEGYEGSPK